MICIVIFSCYPNSLSYGFYYCIDEIFSSCDFYRKLTFGFCYVFLLVYLQFACLTFIQLITGCILLILTIMTMAVSLSSIHIIGIEILLDVVHIMLAGSVIILSVNILLFFILLFNVFILGFNNDFFVECNDIDQNIRCLSRSLKLQYLSSEG